MPTDPLFDRLARALAGRYNLLRELGHGGMATVYLATDLKLGRQVAIKVLPPATRQYLGADRFRREIQLAAQLCHPHIVPLFEADEADGLLYYVMEYVEGESLAERLRREGPLQREEALRITAEVGDALQYAHERGILHRDVKPENILLSGGHALVADFGIAKAVAGSAPGESLTASGVSVGTVQYMSPEQASGGGHVDGRTDVYALAAVLYEMLAGEPPFTGPSAQAVLARVLTDRPRPLQTVRPEIEPHIERAVRAGLAKLPADRPPSARALVEMLVRQTAEHPSRALPWPRRAALTGIAIAALAAAVWMVTRRRSSAQTAGPPTGAVLVPGGRYLVGGYDGRDTARAALDSFYVDSTEVTVSAYERFAQAGGAPTPWRTRPPERWPVTGVLWAEAQAFCRWRDSTARLPTEAEWEAAARSPEGRRYPWGDDWLLGRANAARATDTLAPVGAFPLGRSWVGAVDLVGNAWEWTATSVAGPGGENRHVIKGGAFNTQPANAAASYRAALPDQRGAVFNTGFRCVRPLAR
jgi:formylglycine-generating enzyme required for sulfatase activity